MTTTGFPARNKIPCTKRGRLGPGTPLTDIQGGEIRGLVVYRRKMDDFFHLPTLPSIINPGRSLDKQLPATLPMCGGVLREFCEEEASV